jgi:hypothetical protein
VFNNDCFPIPTIRVVLKKPTDFRNSPGIWQGEKVQADFKHPEHFMEPSMVIHTYNSNTPENKAGRR